MDPDQKCMKELQTCVPAANMSLIESDLFEVVETDNKCKMEQMIGVMWKMQYCAMEYGVMTDEEEFGIEGEEGVDTEHCSKIRTGVEKCVLDLQIGCFSERENKFLTETMKRAFDYCKEIFAMEEVQKHFEDFEVASLVKELIECVFSATPSEPATGNQYFHGWSFIGGILLTLGLVVIGMVGFKYYMWRFGTGENYRRFWR